MEFDMPKGICSLDDCDRPHKVGGLCAKHYGAKYRSEHREEARERSRLWREAHPGYVRFEKPPRLCSMDGCEEPHFGRGFCRSHYRKDYYSRNRGSERASNKEWREANEEHDRERRRLWYEEHRDYFAAKYLANREALLQRSRDRFAANPGSGTESSRRWREANPEKAAALNRANQKRRRGPVDFAAILERDGMICHICGDPIETMAEMNFDHVIPLVKGGPHVEDNIKPSHAICNQRKGSRIL